MIRKVSPNERLYLACEPLYPPFLIQLRIDGDGSISEAELGAALQKAGEANPGSRLKLDEKNWVDSGQAPRIRRASNEVVREPLRDVTCEVVLIENSILFRAFHGVMDARGLLLWVEDVFRALRGESLKGAPSTMTDQEAVALHAKPRLRVEAKYAPIAKGSAIWTHVHLDETTPNLVSRVAEVITKIAGEPSKFMIPTDLRAFFPDVRTTGNFSNPIFIETTPDSTSAEIQGQILRKLANRDQFMTSSSDRFLLYVPLWMQRKAVAAAQSSMEKKGRFLATGVLSNLGRISLASLSTSSFKARSVVSLPLDTPFCPLTIIMTEHENGTELSISSASGELATKLKQELTRELRGPERAIDIGLFDLIEKTERTAVSQGDRSITYAELDSWSSALAATLPRAKYIAVQLEHSIELVVAILAILKSGAAFVPLDPKLPQERVGYILKDSGASHVIREVTKTAGSIKAAPGERAYAIYTSGSTGLPKGVSVTHRNLMNYLLWARDAYGSGHKTALFTSIGFDLTLTSIFLPLISGGEIRIYENDPFTGFKQMAAENVVTFLKATPSHLRLIEPMSRVKTLVVGGEQLTTEIASRWTCDVFNEYGPTEATIGCVVHKLDREISSVAPIGKPISNTVVTYMNGELVIEGASVAEGYINGLRFNGRYKTGDLVSANASGDLVYQGRVDRQFKVNGNRIEPAEIESALTSHTGIEEAVVGLNSHHQLIAYFKGSASPDEARRYLEGKIARAVIPAQIVRIKEFPLSVNGKIDFDRASKDLATSAASHEPVDSIAAEIRQHASALLKVPANTISISTSLTQQGLDSLALVMLLDRIGDPRLFERAHEFAHEPTIERIADILNSRT